ncbi:ferredoxin [Myceligenerans xiligouense]|uniref:Ferredoxin n=1 Tax=Myceligenerans xiligouense TaxID=253184 RepID=A0A3N4YN37_9MICO|nr:ferredoxin [Myceligenerans xiligouense]RPF20754.1 ferredoxin [Myceligenerans xiligouense]
MRVTIDPTTCIAAGICGRTAPRVFANREEDDGYVSVIDENPPESDWAAAREAEVLCPSATIRIEEAP